MEFDEMFALIISIVLTLAYAIILFKKTYPFVKRAHRICLLKERGDLVQTEAEIVEVETRHLNGLKIDPNKIYIMRIRYSTEKAARGIEHSELLFAKKPIERAGQNITVLYNRDEPSEVMTFDNRESAGAAVMFIKLAACVAIAFAVIYFVIYIC